VWRTVRLRNDKVEVPAHVPWASPFFDSILDHGNKGFICLLSPLHRKEGAASPLRLLFSGRDRQDRERRASSMVCKALRDAIKQWDLAEIVDVRRSRSRRAPFQYNRKRTWLGDALENGETAEAIRTLASWYPEELCRMADGTLPLRIAVTKSRWDVVPILVARWPPAVRELALDGSYVLHLAIFHDAPLHIVQLLVATYPDAVRKKGQHGRLPLHWAVITRRLDIVEFLVDKYKEGLRVKSAGGLLPLHFAAVAMKDLPMAQFLVDRYPQALLEGADYGLLPMHFAASKHFRAPLDVVQFFARKAPKAFVFKADARYTSWQRAIRDDATKEVVQFLSRMSRACKAIASFLSWHAPANRNRRLAKLQALVRRHLVYKSYKDVIRSGVQYKATWSNVVDAAGERLDTYPNWTSLRQKHYDMERSLRADWFQKLDEAMVNMPNRETVLANGEGYKNTPMRSVGNLPRDDQDEGQDEYMPFEVYESSLRRSAKVKNRVLLTNDVLNWCRTGDPTYVGFFVKRVQQLASGQRSRILAKRLKGDFKAAIFETYLEQKSGHRILWTAEALGEVLVWNVVSHKKVSRFARLIDSSLGRSDRQLSDAFAKLGIDSASTSASSHPAAIVLDPFGNTPLTLYTVTSDHAPKLADAGWTPPLRLTPEERAVVESTGTTLVLGRSGTGKTICLCHKIDFDFHLLGTGKAFTQLFVSRSDRLCRFVETAVGSKSCSFSTFNALLSKLESAVATQCKFRPNQRVDFVRFKRDFYRNSKLWGGVDALVVWTNIRSFIKGSVDALSSPGRILSIEDYVSVEKLGKERCRLAPDCRHDVYKAFKAYSKYLAKSGLWDDCDRISHLLECLQHLKGVNSVRFEMLQSSKLYIDECQDFTQSEFLLFFYLSRSGDVFLCGDPAQSVVQGVQFRFKEIRSVAHFVAGADRRHLVPMKPMTVNVNFRSHSGIMNLASAVLKRMFEVFPARASQLDRGLFAGPRPGIIYNVNLNLLNGALSSVLSGSTILVHDEQKTLHKQGLDGYKQMHGIREAKGLEFKSVVVFDFFSGIPQPLQKPWRDLLLGREGHDFAFRFPEVEGHLKLLYTAMTRSVDRLLFVETRASVAGDAFTRWSTATATQILPLDEEPLTVVQDISDVEAFEMSVDEWTLSGFENAETAEATDDVEASISFLDAALHCFKKSGDRRFIAKAQVNLASVEFRSQILLNNEASPTMTEQEMAELLLQLLREELWVEASKFSQAVLPHLPEYTQRQLRANLLKKLPSA
jgi:Ankyrin repeats (many copies)/AAA domain